MKAHPFVVLSDLAVYKGLARLPYARVHVAKTTLLDAASALALATEAYNEALVDTVGDINLGHLREGVLARALPGVADVHETIARAIYDTGVCEAVPAGLNRCLAAVQRDMDLLASVGAGFHNDCIGHWTSCLFWVLAVDTINVEFVVPHLGVRLALEVGDLVVFDPSLAHGLCRPADAGCFVPEHFERDCGDEHQAFLSGTLQLDAAGWAALGCGWRPANSPEYNDAVDLADASIEQRTGSVTAGASSAAYANTR